MGKERVLILGGGTGGLYLANQLPTDRFDVLVVDKSDRNLFQPGLLFIAFEGSRREFSKPIRDLLKPGINFLRGEVGKIDLSERYVELLDGRTLDYDYLVIALGAGMDYDMIPGSRELNERFGDFYSTEENARKLWRTLLSIREGNFVISIGDPVYRCPPGPLKGAFLAAKTIAKRGLSDRVKVVLTTPLPHAYPSKVISDIIEPYLERYGIEVRTFFTPESVDLESKKIVSLEGEEIEFSAATMIPPHRGPGIEVEPSSVLDDDGYIKVDKHTSLVKGFDDVYAIGDCTNAPTSKSGVTAHFQAEVVAKRLQGEDARYNGRTNCPLIMDGLALFVISDYQHPPVPVRPTRFKRIMEDLFIALYWEVMKHPEFYRELMRPYFEATEPEKIAGGVW